MIGVGEGKVLLVLPALLGAAGVIPAGMGYAAMTNAEVAAAIAASVRPTLLTTTARMRRSPSWPRAFASAERTAVMASGDAGHARRSQREDAAPHTDAWRERRRRLGGAQISFPRNPL